MYIAWGLVVLVGLLHLWFMVLEMFLWAHPLGLKTFRNSSERAEATKVLAANQGLYNGFLAAGLFYAAATGSREFAMFFLICVVVAGAYYGVVGQSSNLLRAGGADVSGDCCVVAHALNFAITPSPEMKKSV